MRRIAAISGDWSPAFAGRSISAEAGKLHAKARANANISHFASAVIGRILFDHRDVLHRDGEAASLPSIVNRQNVQAARRVPRRIASALLVEYQGSRKLTVM